MDWRRFPALPFFFSVAAGILCALYTDIPPQIWLWVCIGTFVLACVGWMFRASRAPALVLSIIFFVSLGAFRANQQLGRAQRRGIEDFAKCDSDVVIRGEIAFPAENKNGSWVVALQNAIVFQNKDALNCSPLLLSLYSDSVKLSALQTGDIIIAKGELHSWLDGARLSRAALLTSVGNVNLGSAVADSAYFIVRPQTGYYFRRWIDNCRRWIETVYSHHLSPDAAALCNALVLGKQSEFGASFRESLRITGLSHIFALSGMNVGFLMAVCWVILSALGLPRSIRLWILLGMLFFYMELGREAPSLVRATLMCSVFILGRLLQRRASVLNILCMAAFIELIWRPLDLVTASFLLSYAAVFGISGSYTFFQSLFAALAERWKFAAGSTDILAMTLSAQVTTIPLLVFFFGRLPFLGLIANLIAIPLFAILLLWAILLLVAAAIHGGAAAIIGGALSSVAFITGSMVNFFAALPLSSIALPPLSVLAGIVLVIAVFLTLIGLFKAAKIWIASGIMLGLSVFLWTAILSPKKIDSLTFLSVGNGDAALLRTAGGKSILIDAGPSYEGWSAGERIIHYCSENGIEHLDAIVLTHYDQDHIGGAADVLRELGANIIYTNGDSLADAKRTLLIAAQSCGASWQALKAGDELRFATDGKLTVLWPDSLVTTSAISNERSLVMRMDCDQCSALFMGDADSIVEHSLCGWKDKVRVDLLKIGHHGSKSSSTEELLNLSDARQAIISVGQKNRYGHPHKIVLERLRDHKINYLLTSREGHITFDMEKQRWVRKVAPSVSLARQWKLIDA